MLEIFLRSVGIKICNAVAKSGSGGEVRQRTDAAAGGGGRARRQIGSRGVEARAGSAAAAATGQAERRRGLGAKNG